MSIESAEKTIQGNWEEVKKKIKNQWGKLTDKDIDSINGSYDGLVGKVKELYGCSREEVEKQLTKVINGFDFNSIKKVMGDSFENVKDKSEDVIKYVKQNPVKSVVVAMAVGVLFAKIFKK